MTNPLSLAALMSSRICHDLTSPVGAIGNGLELLAMTDGAAEEELALIADSARTAQAALRFMRIAFGAGAATERLGMAELGRILRAHLETPRLAIATPEEPAEITRSDAKLILLAAMAGATALPLGGQLLLDKARPERLRIAMKGPRIGLEETAAALLDGRAAPDAAEPRLAHLALLRLEAEARGLAVSARFADEHGLIEIGRAPGQTGASPSR